MTVSSPPWPLASTWTVFSLCSNSLPYLIYFLVSTSRHHALNGGPGCQLDISIWTPSRHIKLRMSGTNSSSLSSSLPLLSLAKPCSSCNVPPLMATTSIQLLRPKFLESSLNLLHLLHPTPHLSKIIHSLMYCLSPLKECKFHDDRNFLFNSILYIDVSQHLENIAWHMVGTQYLLNKLLNN